MTPQPDHGRYRDEKNPEEMPATDRPHPLRCETCNFNPAKEGLDFDSCPLWVTLNEKYSDDLRDYKIRLLGSFAVTTGYTSCASHSSAPEAQSAKGVLERFAKSVGLKHGEMVDLMRRNNLKIDNLDDPMQKLAFTFFSEIGELSYQAEVVLEELRQHGGNQEGKEREK